MTQTTIFGKSSAQAVVANDVIKRFMATTKNKYTLGKEQSNKAFFADCLYAITQDSIARRWWKTSVEARSWMKASGIENSQAFCDLFVKNILTLKKEGFHMNVFKNYDKMYELAKKAQDAGEEIDFEKLTALQRKGAEYVMANGRGLNINEVADASEDTKTRLMVVRSKYGTSEVKFYTISGGSINQNDPRINSIKAAYHYETGCRYFEARPILYSSWINLPVERQNATVMTDSSDM